MCTLLHDGKWWGCPCRFDVVGILGEADDEIRLYRNAFDYKG